MSFSQKSDTAARFTHLQGSSSATSMANLLSTTPWKLTQAPSCGSRMAISMEGTFLQSSATMPTWSSTRTASCTGKEALRSFLTTERSRNTGRMASAFQTHSYGQGIFIMTINRDDEAYTRDVASRISRMTLEGSAPWLKDHPAGC